MKDTKSCLTKIGLLKLSLYGDKKTYGHGGELGHTQVNWDTGAGKLGRKEKSGTDVSNTACTNIKPKINMAENQLKN